ncbi:MAG TPA: hypothetical protein VKA21_12530 [Candidatus Binatia bacterium]|nr:hypothetical protein [Candidatus Binatia bacterium]
MLIVSIVGGILMARTTYPQSKPDAVESHLDVQRRRAVEFSRLPGVTGSAVAPSRTDPSRMVIVLYVAPGTTDDAKRRLPTSVDGIPVEVVEADIARPR